MQQTYFNRLLLQVLKYSLVLHNLSYQKDIPQGKGAKTMRFFRRGKADSSIIENLTEGTPPTSRAELPLGYVDVNLNQVGAVVQLTDILEWVAIFDWMEQNVAWLGESAALKCEEVIRNVVIAAMLNSNGLFEQFSGVANTDLTSSVRFTALSNNTPAQGKWTRADALKCITTLKAALVPMVNGRYAAAVAPQVYNDIRLDPTWTQIGEFQKADQLFNRDTVTLDGARYIETDAPERETVYGTYASGGLIYTTMYIGAQAFGAPKMSGTSSPQDPNVVIVRGASKSDPLNQYSLAGISAYYNAVMLNTSLSGDPFRVALLRSKSTADA